MSEYHSTDYYAEKDIFDERGILLLRKGQIISDDIKIRLHRHGIKSVKRPDQSWPNTLQKQDKEVLATVTTKLQERIKVRDTRIFEKANLIMESIIFESKSKPWWVYVNALANYLSWLYTHSIDVGLISLILAMKLGYRDEELFNIGLSGVLHDVGKLLVPKAILQKPDKLTEMDREIIRQHCDLGASSLQGFDLPKEYIDVVMHHHERLDGSGYPKGLKGDEICLNVRIVMVADAVDTLTSYRPHRRPLDMKSAIDNLKLKEAKYPQDLVLVLERMLHV